MASSGYGYGQYGAGGYNISVSTRAFVGALTVAAGASTKIEVVDTYTNGDEISLQGGVWSSSDTNVVIVTSDGTVVGLNQGTATITLSSLVGQVLASTTFTVTAPIVLPPPSYITVPIFLSHLTQVAQNYFDWKDVRVRNNKYSIDAQLLNLGMQQVQLAKLRLDREIGATTLHSCPANIDNGGVYYKQQLPTNFNYALSGHSVFGTRDGAGIVFTPYQDELPIPTRANANPNYSPIQMSSSMLFTTSGIGISSPQTIGWSCQRFGPFIPTFSDRVNFWLDGPGYERLNVTVKITGQRGPTPAFADNVNQTSETFIINDLGWTPSKFGWSSIKTIQILGLPVGVTLAAYSGTFELPECPDPNRPYIHSMFRDVAFDRYWSTSTAGYLTENYLKSDYEGWEFAQSYGVPNTLSAVAVEPNTWGGFAGVGTTLYYFDRREPLPSQSALAVSGLIQEPYYGINVENDLTNVAPVYNIVITPVPYANYLSTTSYRYLVTTPDSNTYVITPNLTFATYSSQAGWRSGAPTNSMSIPLGESGTYIFTLQTVGPNGMLYDSTPWQKLAFNPLATIDLSSIVPVIKGLSFDDRNRLWVWTGTYAVPISLHYDAYVIDQPSQAIYLTDSVDGLVLDGIYL
jgi:hypothetical protein